MYNNSFLLKDEGEYLIPMCTVFGLKAAEREFLVKNQVKLDMSDQITDKNRDNEGIEVATSAYKVLGYRIRHKDKLLFSLKDIIFLNY